MGRSTVHYMLPVYLMFFTFFSTMVGLKITQVFTSPEMFIDSAAQNAAKTIENVCADVFVQRDIPAPPMRSLYQISRCDAVAARATISGIWMAADFAGMLTGIGDLFKNFNPKEIEETIKSAEKVTKELENVKDIGSLTDATEDVIKHSEDAVQDVREITKEAKKIGNLDEVGHIEKELDKIEELTETMKGVKKELSEVETELKHVGTEFNPDGEYATYEEWLDAKNSLEAKRAGLEDELSDVTARFTQSWNNVDVLLGTVQESAGNIIKLAKDGKLAQIAKETGKQRFLYLSKSGVLVNTGKKAQGVWARSQLLFIKNVNIMPVLQFALPGLEDLSMVIDVLKSAHVGIPIYPSVAMALNITDFEGFNDTAKLAINMSIKYNDACYENKTDLMNSLRGLGFYNTLNTVNGLDCEDIFPIRSGEFVSKALAYSALVDFEDALDAYRDSKRFPEQTIETFIRRTKALQTTALNRSISFGEIAEEVGGWGEPEITAGLAAFMEDLDKKDREFENLAGEWEQLQHSIADYMVRSRECRTITLTNNDPESASEMNEIAISNCGIVLDCYLQDKCVVGLPVVKSDPWIPYLPVAVIDAEDVGDLGRLFGFSYGSDTKTVSPGFMNLCSGNKKVMVCAVTGPFKSCKVVHCGRKIDIDWNFNPIITVVSEEDARGNPVVRISGNFLEW